MSKLILACGPTCSPALPCRGAGARLWPARHGVSVIERDLLEQIHSRLTQMERSGETARLNEDLKRRTIARVNRPTPSPESSGPAKPVAGNLIRRSRSLPISATQRRADPCRWHEGQSARQRAATRRSSSSTATIPSSLPGQLKHASQCQADPRDAVRRSN